METIKQSFGRRLKSLRKSRALTREKLAQYVSIDPVSIYRLETGKQWIAPATLSALANYFGVSPAVFFTDDVIRINPTADEALEVIAEALKELKKSN